jgi:hypothetical protein
MFETIVLLFDMYFIYVVKFVRKMSKTILIWGQIEDNIKWKTLACFNNHHLGGRNFLRLWVKNNMFQFHFQFQLWKFHKEIKFPLLK